ncbi:MAG: hypothetical protein JW726_19875 [Anaerolineales bacterium]|nr:hypothetical protein [Anaerolineales bacterium]
MNWWSQLKSDPLPWLLQSPSPGVRYLALRDLLDLPPDDAGLAAARDAAHADGEIAAILAQMHPHGYWSAPGPGYSPKYFSTVWSLVTLAQLGAGAGGDERIGRACAYIIDAALTEGGQFSASGAPSGTADCLQGELCWALLEMGYDDPRLEKALDWMARSVTGEGIAPLTDRQAAVRYYAGKCGPLFACGSNDKKSCAWGAAKVMLAFSILPPVRRTPLIQRAIDAGIDFLFSVDPASALYPSGYSAKPSGNWWKFGFPVYYVTDLLQIVEALVGLGYGQDARLANALRLVVDKQDSQGRWLLEYDYSGKTWVDFGPKKQPNPWVTVRALCALKMASDQ